MFLKDDESQIFYKTNDDARRKIVNAERFKAQREAEWSRIDGEEKLIGSLKVNKRVPKTIDIRQQLINMGVADPDAWIRNYRK